MPSAYDYASTSGYSRARADWVDYPDLTTPIRAADLDKVEQAVYDLKTCSLNVKDFGAKGDNTTNDTNAFSNAITAAYNAGGGIVFMPPGIYRVSGIDMKSGVRLMGAGRLASMIRLIGSSNQHVIRLADARQEQIELVNFVIDGNKTGQAAGNYHGVYIANDSVTLGVFNSGFLNPHHYIDNLIIKNCAGDGLHLDGDNNAGEVHVSNVFAYSNDRYGFYTVTPDVFWDRCSSGQAGSQGFYIASSNSRFVNCKSWFSGRLDPTNAGDGFLLFVTSRIEMVGCEAQDNKRHGFLLFTATNSELVGCTADSNGTGFATACGISLTSTSKQNLITGQSYDRNGTPVQAFCVGIASGCTDNDINVVCGTAATTLLSGTLQDNNVRLTRTGAGSFSKLAIRASTTTSAPSAGAAGALPATPAGYVTITVNGTDRQLPYY